MTKTVTQHLRNRLEPADETRTDLPQLTRTQWSTRFETYMRNRMIVGAYRYGQLYDVNLLKRDMVGSIIKRAEKYRADGNQEHLVDIANLAMIEFVRPSHPNPKFASVDDGEHVEVINGG